MTAGEKSHLGSKLSNHRTDACETAAAGSLYHWVFRVQPAFCIFLEHSNALLVEMYVVEE